MFYKILFLLTVMNFILDVKKYIHEYRVWLIAKNKVQCDDVPIGLYLNGPFRPALSLKQTGRGRKCRLLPLQ